MISSQSPDRDKTELRAEVIKAVQTSGLTIRDIAEVFSVSTGSICLWMRQAGIPKVRGVKAPPECHPTRVLYAKALCSSCYQQRWKRGGYTRGPYRQKVLRANPADLFTADGVAR